jgi:hypothetical protein
MVRLIVAGTKRPRHSFAIIITTDTLSVLVEGRACIDVSCNAHTLSHRALTIIASENRAGSLLAARSGETDCSDRLIDWQTMSGSMESSIAA